MGSEANVAVLKLFVQSLDVVAQQRAVQTHPQVADAHAEQLFVAKRFPC